MLLGLVVNLFIRGFVFVNVSYACACVSHGRNAVSHGRNAVNDGRNAITIQCRDLLDGG